MLNNQQMIRYDYIDIYVELPKIYSFTKLLSMYENHINMANNNHKT